MENYQRALNYETVVRVLQKADSYCWDQFLQISNECDTREELPFNINIYSDVLGVRKELVNEAYYRCRQAFELLDDNTRIIDETSAFWPDDVTGIPFLYLKGEVGLLQSRCMSVVGTRNPSNRGMTLAREVVDSLGESGFTIVSGLAMGIDGVAHIEALSKDFNTIGVIGTSVCEAYPPKHEKLQALVAQYGLLVSQFAPSRKVQQYFFMQRNLLMSQISLGSFVIESKDGGGGVKQAQYSEKQGKKVFILRETYDNRTYLWPRQFKDPVIISLTGNSGSIAKRSLQIARTFGRRKTEDVQPSLF
jgi:DNA processing protein